MKEIMKESERKNRHGGTLRKVVRITHRKRDEIDLELKTTKKKRIYRAI